MCENECFNHSLSKRKAHDCIVSYVGKEFLLPLLFTDLKGTEQIALELIQCNLLKKLVATSIQQH
jgi:hypothetical protein